MNVGKHKKIALLLITIQEKQREMISVGVLKGLASEETIKCSIELDHLLNEYHRLQIRKKEAAIPHE
jgi:hypothetical protein